MALGYSTDAAGGVLTQEEVRDLLIDPLTPASVVLNSGARVIDSQGGVPVRIPLVTAVNIGATNYVAEGTQIPATDPALSEVTLLPTSVWGVKTWTSMSNELLNHSDAAARLGPVLVRAVASELDRALLAGTGANGQPRGLVNQADVGKTAIGTTATPVALNVDHIIDALGRIAVANAVANAIYVHPGQLTLLRKLKNGGDYVLQPDVTQGLAPTLLGVPVYASTHVPAGTVIVADTAAIVVARDVGTTISLHPETEARNDSTAIRVVVRHDVGVVAPDGVELLTGLTT